MEQPLILFFGGMIIGLILFGSLINNYHQHRQRYHNYLPSYYPMQYPPPERPRMGFASLLVGLSMIALISILAGWGRPETPSTPLPSQSKNEQLYSEKSSRLSAPTLSDTLP